jgi:hypothetical protein
MQGKICLKLISSNDSHEILNMFKRFYINYYDMAVVRSNSNLI